MISEDNMDDAKIAIFAYNFEHKKTQDMIIRLLIDGHNIECVISADARELNIPSSMVRTKLKHGNLIHPQTLCHRFGIPYINIQHDDPRIPTIINDYKVNLGIIAGARIIRKFVIDSFSIGIINYHPGMIPEVRGLDSILWSIVNNIPLGVTAHLIDESIDGGRILIRKNIPIFHDDTIFDLSERIYDLQFEIVSESVCLAKEKRYMDIDIAQPINCKMTPEQEYNALSLLKNYVAHNSFK